LDIGASLFKEIICCIGIEPVRIYCFCVIVGLYGMIDVIKGIVQWVNRYLPNPPKSREGYLGRNDRKTTSNQAENEPLTALITGASSGLGAEYARQLADRGFNLVLTARNPEHLLQVQQSILARNKVLVDTAPADLSNSADLNELLGFTNQITNLDMLVNCAGFGTVGRFYRVDPEKELAMMRVHMVAPVMLSRMVLPQMIKRNHGTIINVASLAGLIPIRNVMYHSSKAFVINFSQILHTELIGSQVIIQALCPGFVYTQFHDTPEYTRFARKSVPQFLWMTPQQVVSSSLKSLNNGKVICIPGIVYGFAGLLARNSITAGIIKLAAQFVLRNRKTFINS
jgi:short-subunit dehydrogenase